MKQLFGLILGVTLALWPHPAAAEKSAGHIAAEVWTELESVTPGEAFEAGLYFKAEKGWHTYWKNPGDSGIATVIQWELPEGFSATEIQWPTPEKIQTSPLMSFGYSGETLLPFQIRVSNSTKLNSKIMLKGTAKWLECREVCIPGKKDFSLSVAVKANKGKPTSHADAFEKARGEMPVESSDWKTRFETYGEKLTLIVEGLPNQTIPEGEFFFLPGNKGELSNSAPQPVERAGNQMRVRLTQSEMLTKTPTHLQGVLVSEKGWSENRRQGLWVDADVKIVASPSAAPAANSASSAVVTSLPVASLWQMLLFAFLGGLILNLMPCVFPVLSIKILSFVEQAQKKKAVVRLHGFIFAFGVLASFWALAGTLIALRAGGEKLGWGFQLQSPPFLVLLSALMFLMGLNLLGVFEVGNSLMGLGGKLSARSGYAGSFFTGVLATVVATPCTAPFMGSAVGFALTQNTASSMLIFTSLGLGMALPYLILSCVPALLQMLPRPGRWMETLKQLMAFPLFATVIWLVWVFGFQVGMDGVARLLCALLILSLAAWVLQRWGAISQPTQTRRMAKAVCSLLVLISLSLGASATKNRVATGAATQTSDGITWIPYQKVKLAELRAAGKTVFLDFTAAWCLSCQVNEKLVFGSAEVRDRIKTLNLVTMKADWTNGDTEITDILAKYGRSGIPFYLLYSGDASREPKILPEVLTPGVFLEALNSL